MPLLSNLFPIQLVYTLIFLCMSRCFIVLFVSEVVAHMHA